MLAGRTATSSPHTRAGRSPAYVWHATPAEPSHGFVKGKPRPVRFSLHRMRVRA
jgi:hypothetical protein